MRFVAALGAGSEMRGCRRLAKVMELRDVPDDARREVARHVWAVNLPE
jgi:hypothetical protein